MSPFRGWSLSAAACAFDIRCREPGTGGDVVFCRSQTSRCCSGISTMGAGRRDHVPEQSLLLPAEVEPSSQQVECCYPRLSACECYFRAFQFVVWSGTSAKDALASVLFGNTYGNA